MVDYTRKERKTRRRRTRRRKRTHGLFREADQLGELCDLDVAVIIHNLEDGQYHICRSTDGVPWPPSVKKIVSDPLLCSVAENLMRIISLRVSCCRTSSPRIVKGRTRRRDCSEMHRKEESVEEQND